VTAVGGAVYDRGYRPYDGPRGGRGAARFALYRASIRRALGLRRSWRQKVAPFVLLGIVTIPAVINVGVAYLTRNSPVGDRIQFITYREYVGVSSSLLVFVALTAPDIVCPDRRQRVLPLLFARPLTGFDYVVAKVGALATILFAFSFLPQVLLFVGQALVSDSTLDYVRDNADVTWKVAASCAVLAAFYAVVGVAIASLASRRIVAGAAFIGLFLVSSIVSEVLVSGEAAQTNGSLGALVNVLALPLVLRDVIFLGHIAAGSRLSGVRGGALAALVAYVWVLVIGLAVLFRRYRWTERCPRPSWPDRRRPPARRATRPSSPTPPSTSVTCRCGSARRWRCPSSAARSDRGSPGCWGPTGPARRRSCGPSPASSR
jgi:ABC-2 type transport system permease protein